MRLNSKLRVQGNVGDATFGLTPKAFGRERGSSEATSEGEEGAPEGLGAKGDERRPVLPKRCEEVAHAAKGQGVRRRDKPRHNPESPFARAAKTLIREGKKSEATPLSEYCTECTAVIPLISVGSCNITVVPREYSKIPAVRG